MTERMDHLRAELQRQGLAALLVSKPPNTRYLCGATGTACELLVTGDDALLFSGFVDITQNAETNGYMVSINELMGFRPVEVSAEFVKRL